VTWLLFDCHHPISLPKSFDQSSTFNHGPISCHHTLGVWVHRGPRGLPILLPRSRLHHNQRQTSILSPVLCNPCRKNVPELIRPDNAVGYRPAYVVLFFLGAILSAESWLYVPEGVGWLYTFESRVFPAEAPV
jgi:hypothetical protein